MRKLKLYTHSNYSTKSHCIYLGYLQQKLLSINYTVTPKVSIQDCSDCRGTLTEAEYYTYKGTVVK